MTDTAEVPAERSEPGARIVIIEDDAATLAGWTELLRDAGYDAVPAASFEAGRDAIKSGPALLVVDVRLGAFNGLQLIIRARSDYPDIRLIVVTGYADEGVQSAAGLWGATYLEKPVHPERLLAAVADALARPVSKRASPGRRREPAVEAERRRWPRPEPERFVVATPRAKGAEKELALHPSLIEDGDVIVARESAALRPGDVATGSSTAQFRVTVRGLHYLAPRVFARYDHAILQGEAMAAKRHVRLFYVDAGILMLLQDHRPTGIVH